MPLKPGEFIENWDAGKPLSEQSFTGMPSLRIRSLLKVAAGSLALGWTAFVVAPMRAAAVGAAELVAGFLDIGEQLLTAATSGGRLNIGGEVYWVNGPLGIVETGFATAATWLTTQGVASFMLAVVFVLVLAWITTEVFGVSL